jgi:hypothetical protein
MEFIPRATIASLQDLNDEVRNVSRDAAYWDLLVGSTPVAWREWDGYPVLRVGMRAMIIAADRFYADGLEVHFNMGRCELHDPPRGIHGSITYEEVAIAITSFQINWGDDTVTDPIVPPIPQEELSHVYAQAGEYEVLALLTLDDGADCFAGINPFVLSKRFTLE